MIRLGGAGTGQTPGGVHEIGHAESGYESA